MRRLSLFAVLALVVVGCSKKEPAEPPKAELSAPVKEAIYRICKLERTSASDHNVKVLNVRDMTAADFRRALVAFEGRDVHVWMPGERDWLLVGNKGADKVSLLRAMEEFAADESCVTSVPEVFASYAGTREEVLPAFESKLEGKVVPEWFVTKEIPEIDWLDVSGVDDDILRATLAEIRSMQVVRRLVLEGNMLAMQAKDKKGEEEAIDRWARAALRNSNDPMLRERIENLKRNAKGFLEVNKVLQAMKCYETVVLITPNDASAVQNFGMCLKKIGKLDVAEQVLKRADELLKRQDASSAGVNFDIIQKP